jgi:hypothetical protein
MSNTDMSETQLTSFISALPDVSKHLPKFRLLSEDANITTVLQNINTPFSKLQIFNVSNCIKITSEALVALVNRCLYMEKLYIKDCHYVDANKVQHLVQENLPIELRFRQSHKIRVLNSAVAITSTPQTMDMFMQRRLLHEQGTII